MTETLPSISTRIDPKWVAALASDGQAPVDVCRVIVERANRIGEPVGNLKGLQEAKRLVGTYPYQAHDPANYLAGMASVLAEHPLRVVEKAIDRQTRKVTRALLPTRAELQETINEVLRDRWKVITRARAIIERHDDLIAKQREDKRRDDERRELRETLGAAWDAWWAVPLLRRFSDTPQAFAAGWTAADDKEAFCAAWGEKITRGESK